MLQLGFVLISIVHYFILVPVAVRTLKLGIMSQDRQADGKTLRQTVRKTVRITERLSNSHTDRQIDRQTG
jgi:hypothetical protein